MGWLKLKKSEKQDHVAVIDKGPLPPSEPMLAILVPDTGGVSSFRLREFYSIEEANAYLQALMPQLRRGVYPFWALHTQPVSAEDLKVEATVLIRANHASDLVYIVSFLDLESAYSFTRFEVKRGLHLENVMIYWAVFAEAVEEADGIHIYPSEAPVGEPMQSWQAEVRNQVAAAERIALEPPPFVERTPAPIIEREPEPVVDWQPEPIVEETPEPVAAWAPEPVVEEAPEPIVDRAPMPDPVIERTSTKPWSEEENTLQAVERYLQKAHAEEMAEAESAFPTHVAPEIEEEEDAGLWPEATQPAIEEPIVEEPVAEIEPEYVEPEAALEPELITEEVIDDEIDEPLWPEATIAPTIETPIAEPVAEIEELAEVEAEEPMWREAAVAEPVAEIEELAELEAEEPVWAEELVAEPVAEVIPEVAPALVEEEILVDDEAELQALKQAYVFSHEPVAAAELVMAYDDEALIDSSAHAVISDLEPTTAPPELDRGFAEAPVQTTPGDEELDEEMARWQQPDPELPSAFERFDEFDVAYEVERLLKNRAWDKRDGPFSGFKSPPGRF